MYSRFRQVDLEFKVSANQMQSTSWVSDLESKQMEFSMPDRNPTTSSYGTSIPTCRKRRVACISIDQGTASSYDSMSKVQANSLATQAERILNTPSPPRNLAPGDETHPPLDCFEFVEMCTGLVYDDGDYHRNSRALPTVETLLARRQPAGEVKRVRRRAHERYAACSICGTLSTPEWRSGM